MGEINNFLESLYFMNTEYLDTGMAWAWRLVILKWAS